jgi:YVTN family beta-propeller protein
MRFIIAAAILLSAGAALAAEETWLPTGQTVTPLAVPGARFDPLSLELAVVGKQVAGFAVTTQLAPDGRTLFVLTSGYNQWRDPTGKVVPEASTEHIFVYDVANGTPRFLEAVPIANAFGGMALSADGTTLYVGGGADDSVLTLRKTGEHWTQSGTVWKFDHRSGNAVVRLPQVLKPNTAGLALTANGNWLVVANYQNDSITVLDTRAKGNGSELDLRPGKIDSKQKGIAGGEFPYWIAVKGNDTAYVGSLRDREIAVVALSPKPKVAARLKLKGNPTRLLLNRDGSRLYVAEDNADRVTVFDTATNRSLASIKVIASDGFGPPNVRRPGASPNSLALSPDEQTLYVTDGGINAVSVIALKPVPHLMGLIPTAWQPNGLSVSGDGKLLYVVNGKSDAGPVPRNCMRVTTATPGCAKESQNGSANQYVLNKTTGGLATIPVPAIESLKGLTEQVARNNGFGDIETADDRAVMADLRRHIKHVIYIVRENRTYDQILGDVAGGNGDPSLVQFDASITPNAHALASQFVNLDAFYDSGEVSGDGWAWSTAARTTDAVEKQIPPNYADRGMTYDEEGTSRGVNVALSMAQRRAQNRLADSDPDLLPGRGNETAPDGPDGEYQQGYLWNAALRAKRTVRNYGFFLDIDLYFPAVPKGDRIALERNPAAKNYRVALPADPDLLSRTDPYFRGFDNAFPDYWRYREWEREFEQFEKDGRLPALETVRFMHDHTGDFKDAIDGVNTPETQIADNDYAVGLLIEKVAKSRYARDTLVFVIEDDAQDGPDHVDAHRSVAFVAGPYVRHGVVSERYTTVSMIRTIEAVLGLKPMNLRDAHTRPMTAVFDTRAADWSYTARVPPVLRSTQLPLPATKGAAVVTPLHDASYWAQKTSRFDFTAEDRLDAPAYNRILWEGTKPGVPYPAMRSGADLRSASKAIGP